MNRVRNARNNPVTETPYQLHQMHNKLSNLLYKAISKLVYTVYTNYDNT